LLFFERLAVINPPETGGGFVHGGPEQTYTDTERGHLRELQDLGILRSVHPTIDERFAEVIFKVRSFLVEKWDSDDWIVNSSVIEGDANREVQYAAFRFDLVQGVHWPDRVVHLEDIIRFREQRRSEYLAFWDALYRCSQNVDMCDRQQRLRIEVSDLQKAISDIRSMNQQKFGRTRVNAISVWIKPTMEILTALGAALASSNPLSVLPTVVGNSISVFLDCLDTGTPPADRPQPMAFAAEAMETFLSNTALTPKTLQTPASRRPPPAPRR
jgi:hypothetical protein